MKKNSKRYAFNTSWLISERALRLLSSVLVNIWLARHLGPEVFGSYIYCLAIVAILGPVLQLGLRSPLTKKLSEAPDQEKATLVNTALCLRLTTATLFFAAALLYTLLFGQRIPPEQHYLPILFAAQILFSADVLAIRFDSIVESKNGSKAGLAQSLFGLGAKTALILVDAPISYFFGAILLENLVYALVLTKTYTKRFQRPQLRLPSQIATSVLKDSWPLIISGISIVIYMKMDVIMLKSMVDNRAAGIYSAAVSLSESWYFIPTLIAQSLLPLVFKAKQEGSHQYESALSKLSGALIWLSLAIAIATTLLGELAIPILFGPQYIDAVNPLKIHIWAGVFISIGVANSSWFVAEGKQLLAALFTGTGAIANIALNFLLIPLLGPSGAAWATLISYAIAAYLLLPLTSITRPRFLQISRSVFKPSIKGITAS